MNMLKVKEIKEVYKIKAKEENYENDNTLDILRCCSEIVQWKNLVGTDVDKLAFGEYTRRFEKAVKELEELI